MNYFNIMLGCYFALYVLCGCVEPQVAVNRGQHIHIEKANKDSIVASETFIASIDSLLLRPDSGCYVSSIQDLCLSDSNIVILDKAKNIFVFNLNTGKQVAKLDKIGRGEEEYIDPKSILIHKGLLNVLDFKANRVLRYDSKLNYVDDVRISFPAWDFAEVDSGYLFYNMNATSELKQIVHTDSNGRVVGSFLVPQDNMDIMLTDRAFTEDGYGNVFYVDIKENKIYKWANDSLVAAFTMGYGNDDDMSHGNDELRLKSSLVSRKYVQTEFIVDKYVLNNIYNIQTQKSEAGIVSTGTNFPFFPLLSQKDVFFSVVHPFDPSTMREKQDLYLVRYVLK